MMHHKFTVLVLGVIFVFLLGACPAESALVAYMKVGDIRGDATVAGHEHWSEILSYDISVQNNGWQPERDDPIVSLSDMYVTKYTDRASPYLLNGVWTGEHFPHAKIDLVAVSDVPRIYLQWEFHDIVLSNYSTAFNDQSVELVALDFASVDYRYYPGDGSSPIEFRYERHAVPQGIVGSVPAGLVFVPRFEAQGAPEPTAWLLIGSATLVLAATRGTRPVLLW